LHECASASASASASLHVHVYVYVQSNASVVAQQGMDRSLSDQQLHVELVSTAAKDTAVIDETARRIQANCPRTGEKNFDCICICICIYLCNAGVMVALMGSWA
jgi:hypothetical protein